MQKLYFIKIFYEIIIQRYQVSGDANATISLNDLRK